MTVLSVPVGAADLTAAWLSEALAGVADGARVRRLSRRRIGLGNVADSFRLVIDWDRPTTAPTSVVAKVPAADETSRAAGFATRTYELEACFYNDLAASVWVNSPLCYLARFDAEAGAYVVLLEDLAPAEPGDQLAGCRPEDAAGAVAELAALHAPRWGDEALLELAWLDRPSPDAAAVTGEFVASLFPGFVDRYRDRLEDGVAGLAERLMAALPRYLGDRPGPWTVQHGDFRLDNLLFGGPRVAVLDWQTVRIGPAYSDLAYFIGSGLLPEDRRASEQDLVDSYRHALAQAGVELTGEECWDGYRRYCFDGLVMAVAASMLVARTPRSDDMFMAMANRHGRQALDLGAEEFLAA